MEDQSELRLQAWEMGLPSPEDLTPLSQSLISPQLAIAFGITTQDNNNNNPRAHFDLNRVMHDEDTNTTNNNNYFDSFNLRLFPGRTSSDYKRGDYFGPDEANSGSKDENGDETGLNRAMKRPRLVWTPKLHKRFVDVIEHLGIDKAVPKTIMEMMNVDGLTRENVASHLQKYRLYLKRVEGMPSSEGYSSSKREPSFFECEGFGGNFSLTPQHQQHQQQQQQGLFCNSSSLMPMPVPVPVPPPGPIYGGGYGHLGLNVASSNPSGYCGLESGAYSMFWNRQRG